MPAQEVFDTGEPIAVPVGEETLGRIMNVVGEAVDEAAGALLAEIVRALALRSAIAATCSVTKAWLRAPSRCTPASTRLMLRFM